MQNCCAPVPASVGGIKYCPLSVHLSRTLLQTFFTIYVPNISVKNALIDPITLTFEPHAQHTTLGYPKLKHQV